MTLLFAGCVKIAPLAERGQHAQYIAEEAGWHQQITPAGDFDLAAFVPPQGAKTDTLIIYIEGDGLAWVNRSTPSSDPTPAHPAALQLALREPATAVYLARPCQYVQGVQRRNCSTQYWTSQRFAPPVIDASNVAIDQLKQQFGASLLILVGYSGGGAVAALIAAKRKDVIRLITVAGNLDTATWIRLHRISPLTNSLNPADFWKSLAHIPQTHYVGDNDRMVPPAVARAYAARFPAEYQPTIVVLPGFDHYCCWSEVWRGVSARPQE